MKTFHLTITRIGETIFDGDAVSVSFPGKEGVFEVLAEHEALISLLSEGELRIKTTSGETRHFEIPHGGIAEIALNQATVLL